MPFRDEAIENIRVIGREPFRDVRRITLEKENRSVRRVCECSAKNQLTVLIGVPREPQVRRVEFISPFKIIGSDIVEK